MRVTDRKNEYEYGGDGMNTISFIPLILDSAVASSSPSSSSSSSSSFADSKDSFDSFLLSVAVGHLSSEVLLIASSIHAE